MGGMKHWGMLAVAVGWVGIVAEGLQAPPTTGPTTGPTNHAEAGPSTVAAVEPVSDKRAVPSAAAQQVARAELRKKLAAEFGRTQGSRDKAAERAEQLRLASVLLARGGLPLVEPAERYVALTEARDLSVAAGDAAGAVAAATALLGHFDMQPGMTLVMAMTLAVRQAEGPQQHKANSQAGLRLSRQLEELEDFLLAQRASELAEQAAVRAGDLDLQKTAVLRSHELKEGARLAAAYASAKRVLETEPMSPSANRAAGEYLCFVRGQWSRGLLHLSRADDTRLREAAEKDLAATTAVEKLAAADAWYGYVSAAPANQKLKAMWHARGLYEQAYGGLSGAERERAGGRVVKALESAGSRPVWALDGELMRSRLGGPVSDWLMGLKVGEFSFRTDDTSNVYSRAVVNVEGTGGETAGAELRYRLLVLCVDGTGRRSVLERSGKVQFSSDGKTMRVPGPRNVEIRQANNDSPVPADAHVTVYQGDEAVFQALWKSPPTTAWWLEAAGR